LVGLTQDRPHLERLWSRNIAITIRLIDTATLSMLKTVHA